MNETIFNEEVERYLIDDMSICVEDLTKKILADAYEKRDLFNAFLTILIDLYIPYKYKDDLSHRHNEYNRNYINKVFNSFVKDNEILESRSESKEYFILDNIRHAFINFKQGGILQMYQGMEREGWYPKVIINSFIGVLEDIIGLTVPITVYRGTSIDEYNSKKFGQSWTLSKEIAKGFAFEHYSSQPKYRNTLRTILKVEIISTDSIFYYSNNDHREKEVIINPKKIKSVNVKVVERGFIA